MILGDSLMAVTRLGRASGNALTYTVTTNDRGEVAEGRQKGGAGVLLGFKNGGGGTYNLSGKDGVSLQVVVGSSSTITRDGAPLGKVASTDGKSGARIEDADGQLLAMLGAYAGDKADPSWAHPLTTPDGAPLGTLTLVRNANGWAPTVTDMLIGLETSTSLKLPAMGATLMLDAPVSADLGDILVGASIDMSVLPRGYVG